MTYIVMALYRYGPYIYAYIVMTYIVTAIVGWVWV